MIGTIVTVLFGRHHPNIVLIRPDHCQDLSFEFKLRSSWKNTCSSSRY